MSVNGDPRKVANRANRIGKSLNQLVVEYPENDIQPQWEVTKGQERLKINPDGSIEPLQPGEATIEGTIPGIASKKGFLFIQALGRVGAIEKDGTIHWDILGMVIFFGLSIYVNQMLSGQSGGGAQQQQMINKITPVLFSMMFLWFPLPAGVLMYIVVANVFQTAQTFILMREPLPENLQKLVAEQEKTEKERDVLPFERKRSKKKQKTSG